MNAHPARSAGAPEGPALPTGLRDRLFDQVLGLLEADPAVAGVALVGSLGRGEEDNWSDIDLLILASDRFIRQFMNDPAASPWARADLLSDGRHNSPVGATSLGTTHIRSGLPLRVDLHVHPADRTPWPTDGRVVFERRPIRTGTLPFGEFNAGGPRQPATAKTGTRSADPPRLHPHRWHVRWPPLTARRRDDPLPGAAARLQRPGPGRPNPRAARHRGRPILPVPGPTRRCGRLLPRPRRGNHPARGRPAFAVTAPDARPPGPLEHGPVPS